MSKPKDQGNYAAKQKQATKNLSGKRSHSMKKKKNLESRKRKLKVEHVP